jgi:hypothetical protein
MRSRMLLGLLAIGTIVVGILLVGPAGAARRGARRSSGTSKSVNLKFPMPAQNSSQIDVATIKATAPKGETVGAVTVKTTNDSQLQTINPSAVFMVQTPTTQSRTETIKVYALIKRFFTKRGPSRPAMAGSDTLSARVTARFATGTLAGYNVGAQDCSQLSLFDGLFETGRGVASRGRTRYKLDYAWPPEVDHASKPEEILDNVIADAWVGRDCPGKPEGDDPGAT